MALPAAVVDRVRDATDIVEVIGSFVELRKAGANLKGLCPFHSEKTPSFIVSPSKQLYHCFGCGRGGNVFTFLIEHEKLSFAEALERLAQRAGIELPKSSGPAGESERIYAALEFARDFFAKALASRVGEGARSYLARRGVSDQTAGTFSLGYAPDEWSALLDRASKAFPIDILERAGLVIPREKKTGHYDRFRHRLMVPILSASGRTVAFGARALRDEDTPKYLNSPETPVYHKGSALFALPQARAALREKGEMVLVEGYMDVMSLHEAGFRHAVGCCGTALTPEQARLARRFVPRVVLLFDGDPAGVDAARRGLGVVLGEGLSASVALLPAGADPDDFVRSSGAAALEGVLAARRDPVEFIEVLHRRDGGPLSLEEALHAVRDLLAAVPDPIVRRLMVQRAAERFRFDETVLLGEVEKASRSRGAGPQRRGEPARPSPAPVTAQGGSEWDLLRCLYWEPALLDDVGNLWGDMPLSGGVRQAVDLLVAWRGPGGGGPLGRILDAVDDPQIRSILSEAAVGESEGLSERERAKAVGDIRRWIGRAGLRARIKQLDNEIRGSEGGAGRDLAALLRERQALQEELAALLKE
jgi:DNA primase